MSHRAHGPRSAAQLHRDEVARARATRLFLDEPEAQRDDDEVINDADELLNLTATVKGLRAAEEA